MRRRRRCARRGAALVTGRVSEPGGSTRHGERRTCATSRRAPSASSRRPQAPPVRDDTGKLLVTAALERLAVWDVRRGVEAKSLLPPPRESGALPAVTRIARARGSSTSSRPALRRHHPTLVPRRRIHRRAPQGAPLGGDRAAVQRERLDAGVGQARTPTWWCGTSSPRRACVACADTRIRSRTPSSPRRTPPPAAGLRGGGARLVTCSKDATVKRVGPGHAALRADRRGARRRVLEPGRGPDRRRLAVGTNDDRLHVFAVRRGRRPSREEDVRRRRLRRPTTTSRRGRRRAIGRDENVVVGTRDARAEGVHSGRFEPARPRWATSLALGRARASTLRFDADAGLLGVQTVGRAVEVYRAFEPRRRWRSD